MHHFIALCALFTRRTAFPIFDSEFQVRGTVLFPEPLLPLSSGKGDKENRDVS